jgi:hypothetical protein
LTDCHLPHGAAPNGYVGTASLNGHVARTSSVERRFVPIALTEVTTGDRRRTQPGCYSSSAHEKPAPLPFPTLPVPPVDVGQFILEQGKAAHHSLPSRNEPDRCVSTTRFPLASEYLTSWRSPGLARPTMKAVRPLRNFTCPPASGFLKRSILPPINAA